MAFKGTRTIEHSELCLVSVLEAVVLILETQSSNQGITYSGQVFLQPKILRSRFGINFPARGGGKPFFFFFCVGWASRDQPQAVEGIVEGSESWSTSTKGQPRFVDCGVQEA